MLKSVYFIEHFPLKNAHLFKANLSPNQAETRLKKKKNPQWMDSSSYSEQLSELIRPSLSLRCYRRLPESPVRRETHQVGSQMGLLAHGSAASWKLHWKCRHFSLGTLSCVNWKFVSLQMFQQKNWLPSRHLSTKLGFIGDFSIYSNEDMTHLFPGFSLFLCLFFLFGDCKLPCRNCALISAVTSTMTMIRNTKSAEKQGKKKWDL